MKYKLIYTRRAERDIKKLEESVKEKNGLGEMEEWSVGKWNKEMLKERSYNFKNFMV